MFSRIFIERPRFAMVISIVLTLAGVISVFSLPISLYPEITPPEVVVSASYPGASAEVVDRLVSDLVVNPYCLRLPCIVARGGCNHRTQSHAGSPRTADHYLNQSHIIKFFIFSVRHTAVHINA